MDNAQKLDLLKLLSAIESWSFSTKVSLPDYLHERLLNTVNSITEELLNGAPLKKPPSF